MFRSTYPDVVKPCFMVWGCIHVRKFASILISLFVLLATVAFVLTLSIQQYNIAMSIVCFILVASTVLAADKLERPSFYTIFLVLQGIFLVIQLLTWIIIVMFFSKKHCNTFSTDAGPDDCLASVQLAQAITISFFLTGCTWNVVFDARRYMITEVCSGNVKLNADLIFL